MLKFLKHFAIASLLLIPGTYVLADYQINQGSGSTASTVFAFVCFVTKICPAHVNVNSAGAEVGIQSAPLRVDPTGTTTQPVNVTNSSLPVTFPSTIAATQSGTWTMAQGAAGPTAWNIGGSVTANAGNNLNTSTLALENGGNLANLVSQFHTAGLTTTGKGILDLCSTTSSAPTNVSGTMNYFSCDTAGNIRVNVQSATGLAAASTTSGQSGSLIMGGARVNSLPTYGDLQTNPLITNTNGGLYVTPSAGNLGGATPYHSYSAASNNATNVKTTAGTVYNISLGSINTTVYYFKLYDVSGTPSCNTDPVKWATQVAGLATGYNTSISLPTGLAFANGIGFCITGAQADNDNSNATTGINIDIAYK